MADSDEASFEKDRFSTVHCSLIGCWFWQKHCRGCGARAGGRAIFCLFLFVDVQTFSWLVLWSLWLSRDSIGLACGVSIGQMHKMNQYDEAASFLRRKSGNNYHRSPPLLIWQASFWAICRLYSLSDALISQNLVCIVTFCNHIRFHIVDSQKESICGARLCAWNIPKHAWVHLWEPIWDKLFTNRSIALHTQLGLPLLLWNCITQFRSEEWGSDDSKTVYEVHIQVAVFMDMDCWRVLTYTRR